MHFSSRRVSAYFIAVAAALLTFAGIAPVHAGAGYACNNFAEQLCAPISTVTFTSDAASSAITYGAEGAAYASTATSLLTFRIDAGVAAAGKAATLQFFDVAAGMHFIVRSNATSPCQAGNTIQKECAIALGTDGTSSFKVSVLGAQPGMSFRYKFVGPEAWTSLPVKVTFTSDGQAANAPDACVANRTQVCGKVGGLSFSNAGRKIAVAQNKGNVNFSAQLVSSADLLSFHYASTPAYAYKFLYVDFFNITSGLNLIIDTSVNSAGIGCDRTVAIAHGCYIQLDPTGSADFFVSVAGGQDSRAFSYKLNGAGYTSAFVTVTLAPTSVFAAAPAASATVTGLTGAMSLNLTNVRSQKVVVSVDGGRSILLKPGTDSASYLIAAGKGRHAIKVVIGKKTLKLSAKVG